LIDLSERVIARRGTGPRGEPISLLLKLRSRHHAVIHTVRLFHGRLVEDLEMGMVHLSRGQREAC
jgi:hypothetical protein